MQPSDIISKTGQYVREALEGDNTGHDWWHIKRVCNLALRIADEESKKGQCVDLMETFIKRFLHEWDGRMWGAGNEAIYQ